VDERLEVLGLVVGRQRHEEPGRGRGRRRRGLGCGGCHGRGPSGIAWGSIGAVRSDIPVLCDARRCAKRGRRACMQHATIAGFDLGEERRQEEQVPPDGTTRPGPSDGGRGTGPAVAARLGKVGHGEHLGCAAPALARSATTPAPEVRRAGRRNCFRPRAARFNSGSSRIPHPCGLVTPPRSLVRAG
jgi:hypothetical protein